MNRAFRRKNKVHQIKEKKVEPRELSAIQKEYTDLLAKVAQAQYLAFVHNLEVDNLNKRLLEVNKEANERQKLDTEKANSAPAAEVQNG